MANTGMAMGRWVSPGAEDQTLRGSLQRLQQEFISAVSKRVRERGLNPRAILVTSPHDSVVCLTSTSVVMVISRGTATDATSTDSYGDFRAQPSVTADKLIRDAQSEFGWADISYWVFEGSVFTDTSARRSAFDSAAQKLIDELERKANVAKKLGISEAAVFLQNARARFESETPTGYNDCKANCRSALVSLIAGLSGKDDTREGIRLLAARGELGNREAEVIQAVEDLVGALKGLASKKGSHPPLADENDAFLTLRLTEATFDYLVREVATKRGT